MHPIYKVPSTCFFEIKGAAPQLNYTWIGLYFSTSSKMIPYPKKIQKCFRVKVLKPNMKKAGTICNSLIDSKEFMEKSIGTKEHHQNCEECRYKVVV